MTAPTTPISQRSIMLFEPLVAPTIRFANRAVMAPMTRSRAIDANTPNALMAEYYGQRATAGLIT